MSILILKNGERIAINHFKRVNSRKHVRGIMRFYKALYAGSGARITMIILGA